MWPEPAIDYAIETDIDHDFEDRSRWLLIGAEGLGAAYQDMVAFIDTINDTALAERLDRALGGKRAFRRFRSVLDDSSQADFTRWHRFSADSQRGRARAWLADNGYHPAPPSPAPVNDHA